LEQSKNRNHKIMITDMAISKVPYVEIPGYTKAFCNNIQPESVKLSLL